MKVVFRHSLLFMLISGFVLLAFGFSAPLWARQSRLSAAVALTNKDAVVADFLRQPTEGYVQAYVLFQDTLADDVIMLIDQELIEGIKSPLYVYGGDWMAFVGLQRTGIVWVGAGTDATMKGEPSHNRDWKIIDLKTRLEPNVWYRIEVRANFKTRYFNSFSIEGPNLRQKLDLSSYKLDYPNMMPFSDATMSYYVGAMRGRDMMKAKGVPQIFFDDVEGGIILSNGKRYPVFADGFERQTQVGQQPVSSPVINLGGYQQGYWYLEQNEALFRIEKASFAHSGGFVGVADADLEDR